MLVNRQSIIASALLLLDEMGLDGLTMRKLAVRLGIKAASLYHHFDSKQQLVEALADELIAGVVQAEPKDRPWEQEVTETIWRLRRAFLSRRDGALVFAGAYGVTENVLHLADHLIGCLRRAGAGLDVAVRAGATMIYFVLGFCIEEQAFARQAADASELDRRRREFDALARARFPELVTAQKPFFDADFDRRFTLGVSMQLNGLKGILLHGGG